MTAQRSVVVLALLAVLLTGCGANSFPSRQNVPADGTIIATDIACPNGYQGRFVLLRDPGVTAAATAESITIPGYRWVIEVTPPATLPPPPSGFGIEVFAWGRGYGTHGEYLMNAPATVTGTGAITRWRWTDAVRIAPPANDITMRGIELWPHWAESVSVNSYPYRVRLPVPLYVGSIAFDVRETGNGVAVTRPYVRKPTGCYREANMVYPDDFPEQTGR